MTGFGITYAAAAAPQIGQGPSLPNDVVSGLLTAVGGGIVGATISLLVTEARTGTRCGRFKMSSKSRSTVA